MTSDILTIDRLSDQVTELEAEIARLRKALRWYADDDNYTLKQSKGWHVPVQRDHGKRARAALGEKP